MMSTQSLLPNSVLLAFVAISGIFAAVTLSDMYSWSGTAQLHTGIEAVATVLAFIVGVSLLTRYAIAGGSKALLLGLGFTGTGVLDGYHTLVTSVAFTGQFPSLPDSLIPWSWMASRILLGGMFLLVALDLKWSFLSFQRPRGALVLSIAVAALTVVTLLFFALVPLPKAQFDLWIFGRPQELFPAVLFVVAMIGLALVRDWQRNPFDLWILVAVVANVFAQTLFMPFSNRLFDSEFDVAHLFKVFSYVAMFAAVMTDMKRTIVNEQQVTGQLDALDILRTVSMQEITPDSMFPVVAEQVMKLVAYDRLTISTTNGGDAHSPVVLVYETGVKMLDRSKGTVVIKRDSNAKHAPFPGAVLMRDVTEGNAPDLDAASVGLRAWAEVPLIAGGQYVGVLSIRSKRPGAYAKRDVDLLESAAGYLAPMLNNAFMFDRLSKSEQQLKDQSLELRASNESLEQFAYIASHDLQEPLRKVTAFGNRLKSSLGDNISEKAADYLARMVAAATRMQDLVQGLLEFSRVGSASSDFVPTDLTRVVEGAQDSVNLAISESRATFQLGQLGTVHGNETQLRQVFANLIMNSIKYRRPDVVPEISISASRTDSEITVTYADNGQGFETQYEQQIFDIFRRLHTREEVAGTGLGLALCRRIVDKHHGSITAHGYQGSGAVFVIRLPASVSEGPAAETDESTDAA